MTNTLAIVLGLLIVGGLVVDHTLGLGIGLFLARRFADLVEWTAFWR